MFHAEQMFSKTQVCLSEEKSAFTKRVTFALNFCSWRLPLLDAKDTKVERNIWLYFVDHPRDIKIV